MKNEVQEQLSIEEDQPTGWFEPLYARSNTDGEGVPWANMKTHPSFDEFLTHNPLKGDERSALVIGCGMGDDAIALESLGFQVTAFDVSETAIKYCKQRFSQSKVNFVQADLLAVQSQWQEKFDFVLEIFTVQALPPRYEKDAIQNICSFVAPAGQLLVIAEVSREERTFENGPPWVLTPRHVDSFVACGFSVVDSNLEEGSSDNGYHDIYVTSLNRNRV